MKKEYKNRKKNWGHKERDALRSFQDIRKEIINNYDPALDSEIIEKIAKLIRGLMKHDTEKCVDEYNKNRRILYKPDHPTNTCDPFTGNWAEHLMHTEWLEGILRDEGFEIKTLSGYCPYDRSLHKKFIKNMLNISIRIFRRKSLLLSLYYILSASFNV